MALTIMTSIVNTSFDNVSATNNYGVMREAGYINDSGLQANLTFPDCLNYVDDTLIVNNMYTFKGYKGQGKLYITCTDNLESARIFINGKEIDVTEACRNNGKTYEIDFSEVAENDRNTIQVTNFCARYRKGKYKNTISRSCRWDCRVSRNESRYFRFN